jgi:hypothetical protein
MSPEYVQPYVKVYLGRVALKPTMLTARFERVRGSALTRFERLW